jgi:hypothetical protein
MGFEPTGPRRLGDLVFPTTRKRWVAARASDGEAARARLGVGESGLRCTSCCREGIYGGGGLGRSSRVLQFGLGRGVSVWRWRGVGLGFMVGKHAHGSASKSIYRGERSCTSRLCFGHSTCA